MPKEKKTANLNFRITQSNKNDLDMCAKKLNLSLTELMDIIILDGLYTYSLWINRILVPPDPSSKI